ncbi:uncharacterized protein ASCRUDRAFT_5525 [Ascoidea rubescens DSM 1968]|uniref:Uncharacterized protein n=1 Tax=Ascoidea rubescens DSM 1968 TaxID=1344418 RepID=A0A1D2VPK2_9ASCO|nr:hypothetical protein ASCRUDRAFT_5525 [Ascoidea rubescens DSM 1968]ODV63552.1 hypothetical protein ASCRUDRAFT_5525 [Ascoidea rubescens DSM 1968]
MSSNILDTLYAYFLEFNNYLNSLPTIYRILVLSTVAFALASLHIKITNGGMTRQAKIQKIAKARHELSKQNEQKQPDASDTLDDAAASTTSTDFNNNKIKSKKT